MCPSEGSFAGNQDIPGSVTVVWALYWYHRAGTVQYKPQLVCNGGYILVYKVSKPTVSSDPVPGVRHSSLFNVSLHIKYAPEYSSRVYTLYNPFAGTLHDIYT